MKGRRREGGSSFESTAHGHCLCHALPQHVAVSSGSGQNDLEKMSLILEAVPQVKFICLDVANGYSEHFVEFVKLVRSKFPEHTIMVSTVGCFQDEEAGRRGLLWRWGLPPFYSFCCKRSCKSPGKGQEDAREDQCLRHECDPDGNQGSLFLLSSIYCLLSGVTCKREGGGSSAPPP